MSDAPFVEKPIAAGAESDDAKAARQRLAAALAELNPAGGKTDAQGDSPAAPIARIETTPPPLRALLLLIPTRKSLKRLLERYLQAVGS